VTVRSFVFSAGIGFAESPAAFGEKAMRAEALGYGSIGGFGDHFSTPWAIVPALAMAALSPTSLPFAAFFCNDFRHPALLAKEVATLDVLSGGRLQVGIGAGWDKDEYDRSGIAFEPAGIRISRLEEAVRVVKGLWAGAPLTYEGRHYQIRDLTCAPLPVQRPHPPLMIGGGGRRLLRFAAREADVVGIVGQALSDGGIDTPSFTEELLSQKIGWIREAAGERFDQLQLELITLGAAVTEDRLGAARQIASGLSRQAVAYGLTAEQVLENPCFLIGTVDDIVEQLVTRRERHGIARVGVPGSAIEAFAPIVARLAGR
jgi:probable F420-dependent oxidoreductase